MWMSLYPGHDNEMKYDNLARSLSMMEDELKRADERVRNAEARVVVIEDELAAIGENQKQLEVSEEKARKREEKYQDQIKQLNIRLKQADSRYHSTSPFNKETVSRFSHWSGFVTAENSRLSGFLICWDNLKAYLNHNTASSNICSAQGCRIVFDFFNRYADKMYFYILPQPHCKLFV